MKKESFCRWALVSAFFLAAYIPAVSFAQDFAGTWNYDKSQSKNVGAFFESGEMRYRLVITSDGSGKMVIVEQTATEAGWKKSTLNVDLNGPQTTSEFPRGDIARFSFEAVAIGPDQTVMTKAVQGSDRTQFDLTSRFTALVSQGTYDVVLKSHYALSADGKTLTVTETRNSRVEDEPAVYVFHRAN